MTLNNIGIYKITNPNGKIYIGQSTNIEKRFKTYFKISQSKTQTKLNRSFYKYGINNHIFEILEICSIELLNERERYYQDLYNVLNNGLNCRLTETNNKSGKLSEAVKLKMSKSQKGRKLTIEHKQKLSIAKLNNKRSLETRLKISQGHIGIGCKKIIDIETNIIYSSIKETCIIFNIKRTTLIAKLTGQNKNNTSLRYYNDTFK